MNVSEVLRRVESRNPLHPYRWIAHYRGGGRLRQFDVDGYHRAAEIDRARVERLEVVGPGGPYLVPVPAEPGRAPDEVIIKATVDVSHTLGTTGFARSVRRKFGFRVGAELLLLELDDQGRAYQTNRDQ